jgi:hypothetical protein
LLTFIGHVFVKSFRFCVAFGLNRDLGFAGDQQIKQVLASI